MSAALKLNRYRDKLNALRERMDAQAAPMADQEFDAADVADRANRQAEIVLNFGLATHEAFLRREIDDALERINAGTFALCENCNAVIGAHRLQALPYARYCVRCERRIERNGQVLAPDTNGKE